MTKIRQVPIRYYDDGDIYTTSVDNRPLADIATNIDLINTQLSSLGFYQQLFSDPSLEPPGGFLPLTCAYLAESGRLSPIDIATPVSTLDYSKYSIYLITKKLDTPYLYDCIAFSASLTTSEFFNSFLPDSIGKGLKVGPGGSLVDEIFFDLYYSNKTYQSILVGKILSQDTISFGGNQVSTLTDNRFIVKNRDGSTTGLVEVIRDIADSAAVFKGSVLNTVSTPYPFIEYQNYLSQPEIFATNPIPVYFTNKSISFDPGTGSFTNPSLNSNLNEIHFRSPEISATSLEEAKYRSAGVNVGSLLDFAQLHLLHSNGLSSVLQEVTQTISTHLVVDNSTNSSTLFKFGSSTGSIGTSLDSTTKLPSSLLVAMGSSARGLSFNGFSDSTSDGIFIGSIVDNTLLSSVTDGTSGMLMSELVGSTSLLISSKNSSLSTSAPANIFLYADGYIGMFAKGGIFYGKAPEKADEIVNKSYVDSLVLNVSADSVNNIPLDGNDSTNPVTSSIYFDVKSSANPSTVFKFDSLLTTEIDSANPVEFRLLSSPTTTFQTVRGDTPNTGDDHDLTNRAYVASQIAGIVTGTGFVSVNTPQTITAQKTFTTTQIINDNNPLTLLKTSGTTSTITTDATYVIFDNTVGGNKTKIQTDSTESSDPATTVVTKDYMQAAITAASTQVIWGSWNLSPSTSGLIANQDPDVSHASFASYIQSTLDGSQYLLKNISSNTLTVKVAFTGIFFALNTVATVLLNKRSGSTDLLGLGKTYSGSYTSITGGIFGPNNAFDYSKGSLAISSIQVLAPGESVYFTSSIDVPSGFSSSATYEFAGQGTIDIISIV